MKNWKRILVPTDLSPLGDEAAGLVAALARVGAKVKLLHILEPTDFFVGIDGTAVGYYGQVHSARVQKEAEKRLAALAGKIGKRRCSCQVLRHSLPAAAIAKAARAWKADLVCLSTHGRSAWSRLFIGSEAQKLLAHYKGTVLLLKPDLSGPK